MIRVAIVGAESTGKSELALSLCRQLNQSGRRTVVVAETLRQWCDQHGRTPRSDEQAGIAREQARRIDAVQGCDIVLADTTALMVAVYSELLFGDRSLHAFALEQQRGFDLTLLTGLDLPWVADGIQRDGPQVRAGVDALLRSLLEQAAIGYATVYGSGSLRSANALRALGATGAEAASQDPHGNAARAATPWRWECDKCSDPGCEHRLFGALLSRG